MGVLNEKRCKKIIGRATPTNNSLVDIRTIASQKVIYSPKDSMFTYRLDDLP
jgi:hypothetical protein